MPSLTIIMEIYNPLSLSCIQDTFKSSNWPALALNVPLKEGSPVILGHCLQCWQHVGGCIFVTTSNKHVNSITDQARVNIVNILLYLLFYFSRYSNYDYQIVIDFSLQYIDNRSIVEFDPRHTPLLYVIVIYNPIKTILFSLAISLEF